MEQKTKNQTIFTVIIFVGHFIMAILSGIHRPMKNGQTLFPLHTSKNTGFVITSGQVAAATGIDGTFFKICGACMSFIYPIFQQKLCLFRPLLTGVFLLLQAVVTILTPHLTFDQTLSRQLCFISGFSIGNWSAVAFSWLAEMWHGTVLSCGEDGDRKGDRLITALIFALYFTISLGNSLGSYAQNGMNIATDSKATSSSLSVPLAMVGVSLATLVALPLFGFIIYHHYCQRQEKRSNRREEEEDKNRSDRECRPEMIELNEVVVADAAPNVPSITAANQTPAKLALFLIMLALVNFKTVEHFGGNIELLMASLADVYPTYWEKRKQILFLSSPAFSYFSFFFNLMSTAFSGISGSALLRGYTGLSLACLVSLYITPNLDIYFLESASFGFLTNALYSLVPAALATAVVTIKMNVQKRSATLFTVLFLSSVIGDVFTDELVVRIIYFSWQFTKVTIDLLVMTASMAIAVFLAKLEKDQS